jgi:peptidoglycan/xylan/chitin deacetylase (PgdA/CDA1 family)
MAELQLSARPGALPRRPRHAGFTTYCVVLALAIALTGMTRGGRASASGGPSPTERASDRRTAAAQAPAPSAPTTRVTSSNSTIRRLLRAGQPIYCGGGTKPLVALTFDDGPGANTTETIAELRRAHMTATFFEVGKLLGESMFEGIPKAAADFGAVGDHTWDHISMLGLGHTELAAEIDRTRRALEQLTGAPVFLFRPPLGQRDAAVDGYVRSLGMLEVLWSLDSGDSQGANDDQIYRTVRDHLSAGDIVLLHENRGTTQNALPRIIDLIRERGYTTVSVPQLLAMDPPSAEQLRNHTCS